VRARVRSFFLHIILLLHLLLLLLLPPLLLLTLYHRRRAVFFRHIHLQYIGQALVKSLRPNTNPGAAVTKVLDDALVPW
jgi:hypothetical protein